MSLEFKTIRIQSGFYEVRQDGRPVGEVARITPEGGDVNREQWEARCGSWSLITNRKKSAKDALIRHVTAPPGAIETPPTYEDAQPETPRFRLIDRSEITDEDAYRFSQFGWHEFVDRLFLTRGLAIDMLKDAATYDVRPRRRRVLQDALVALTEAMRRVEDV